MERDAANPGQRRFVRFMQPEMAALTPGEIAAPAIVMAPPSVAAAVLGWSLGYVALGLLPGLALLTWLRIRANRTRERRVPTPLGLAIGVGAIGGTGASLDRYLGLFAMVAFVTAEVQRRSLPAASDEQTDRRAAAFASFIGSPRVQITIVALVALVAWIGTMAFTQVAACASPKDGGSVHGSGGPFAKAFCGTAGAPSSDVTTVYLLIIGVPLLALALAVVAILRLPDRRPRHAISAIGSALAPASVAVAWVLAGAR